MASLADLVKDIKGLDDSLRRIRELSILAADRATLSDIDAITETLRENQIDELSPFLNDPAFVHLLFHSFIDFRLRNWRKACERSLDKETSS